VHWPICRVGPSHCCDGPPSGPYKHVPAHTAQASHKGGSGFFCRFLTLARSPPRSALKILRRSRRTRSSCIRQSTCCQASASNTPGGSSGPFTEVSNMPFGSSIRVRFVVKGSPAHVSTPYGSRHQVWYPAGYPTTIQRKDPGLAVVGFPLSFDYRHSLLGHPVPPGNSAPITLGLPPPHTPTRARGMDPDAGLPRSTRVRPEPGRALSKPRG
jgi:hypothetical protein